MKFEDLTSDLNEFLKSEADEIMILYLMLIRILWMLMKKD